MGSHAPYPPSPRESGKGTVIETALLILARRPWCRLSPKFLSLGPMVIWGWTILCRAAVLCLMECLAAAQLLPTRSHSITCSLPSYPLLSPGHNDQTCFQDGAKCPLVGGTTSPQVENRYSEPLGSALLVSTEAGSFPKLRSSEELCLHNPAECVHWFRCEALHLCLRIHLHRAVHVLLTT